MAFPPPGAQDPNPSSLPSGGPIPGTLHLLPLRERLALVTETMRELSRQTDPQNMAKVYLRHLRQLLISFTFINLVIVLAEEGKR